MNGFFFASAILYESLVLIRSMVRVFKGDAGFENNLLTILRDPSAQTLEQMHLKSARHGAVFHSLPDRFADTIARTGAPDCVFFAAVGAKRGDFHFKFADLMTAEIGVGAHLDDEQVVRRMFAMTSSLLQKLTDNAEHFITEKLEAWGFEGRPSPAQRP